MIYNGATYYFMKNLQGDVVGVYNSSGTLLGEYVYDAWGKLLNSVSGVLSANPFRYRGYYYDSETALYYLNSRYYDPESGRFLNMDGLSYLEPMAFNGLNLYAYCGNNPVMYSDPSGNSLIAIISVLVTTFIVGAVVGGIKAGYEGKKGLDVFKDIVLGASLGLALGGAFIACVGVFAGAFGGAAATVFGGVSFKQAFAIGALAFDFTAFVIAPIYGFSMQAIEIGLITIPDDYAGPQRPLYEYPIQGDVII